MQSMTPETIVIPEEDIPIWMKKARQGTDWGVLVVLAFSLIAAWPFVLRNDIPAYGALENYAYRGAEYAQSFSELRLYPRWSATALEGYGAPIPHYYAPGVPYIIGALEVLITGNSISALRIVMVAGFILLGTTTYAFVTRFSGATAGVLAAILYIFSPHASVTAPFILGDVPQFLAMGLLPALLWSLHRLLTMHRPLDFTLSVLVAAGLVLTYPRIVPVALLLSFVMMICHVLAGDHKPRVLLIIFVWLFAGAVTTFYWLPAVAEHNLVRWQPQARPAPEVATHALNLLGNLAQVDPSELAPAPQAALGWSLLLFTALGAVMLFSENSWQSIPGWLLGTAVCLIGVMLVDGNVAWLVGPVSLCLAVVGGSVARVCERLAPRVRPWALAALLIVALILAYPDWLSPFWPDRAVDVSARTMIEYERQGFGIATLPPGAKVPSTLVENIAPNFDLISSYNSVNTVRLRSDQLAVGSQVSVEAGEIHADSWIVSASPLIVDVQRANFAGWAAYLNGQRISLLSDPETGLMQIVLPRTDRDLVQIRLESTPVRRRAWWLSGTAIALILIGLVIRVRRPERVLFYGLRLLNRSETRVVMIVLASFAGLLLLVGYPDAPSSLDTSGYRLNDAQAVQMQTADGMLLRGFRVSDARVHPGDELAVTMYWSATQALERNYRVALVLENAATNVRTVASIPHTPAQFPAQRWLPLSTGDYYVRDQATVQVPPLIPPGTYRLGVEVYDCIVVCDFAARREFIDGNGESRDVTLQLPVTIIVEAS